MIEHSFYRVTCEKCGANVESETTETVCSCGVKILITWPVPDEIAKVAQ